MKKIIIISLIIMGCATLGFKDNNSIDVVKNKKIEISNNIAVEFSYEPLIGGKHEVYLSGDFNSWSQNETIMNEEDGIYKITLDLKKGKYSYKFIVDGNWITDENADEFIDDGFGGQNSIIYVGNKNDIIALRKVDFIYKPKSIVKEVYLVGSMNDWNQKKDRMLKQANGTYLVSLLLQPGEYQYKFLEDGMHWITDANADLFLEDGFGGKNSILIIDDNYEKVTIEIKDGLFLNYGISTEQSIENINLLSPNTIEFKTKAHKGDVENIYLLKNEKLIEMQRVASDGSFDYFQKILTLNSESDEFDYCFVYVDGNEKQYLLSGEFSSILDNQKLFRFSKNIIRPFFTPEWVKDGIIYQIFPDRFFDGNPENNSDFSEWYYEGINLPPEEGELHKKYTQYFHNVDDWYDVAGLVKSPFHDPDSEGYQPDYNSFYGGDIEGVLKKLDYLVDLGITIIYFNPLFQAKSNHKYDAVNYMLLDPHFGTNKEFKRFVSEAHNRGIKIIIDCAFNHTGETYFAFQEGMKKGPESEYYNWYEWLKWPLPDPNTIANYKPSDYYRCWWGYGEMPDLNYDLDEINPSENSIKNIDLANPNWPVVNHILDVAEFWISDMDIDGFRLDVPNEVPFWFWKLFRDKVKKIKPDAYLVGELWSNAVDWVNDDYFDAVMNYAYFKDPVMRFFNQRNCSAKDFDRDLKPGRLTYPMQSTQVMMNLIDSHDTFRYLESCNGDISRLKMAVLFQMTYIGTPHIWYGDEVGMMGAHDPDCRRPFNWKYMDEPNKVSLREFYKELIHIRRENSCLRTGSFKTLIADGMIYGYERSDQNSTFSILINNDTINHNVLVDSKEQVVVDLLSNDEYVIKNGKLDINLDAMSGVILTAIKK